MFRFPVPVPVHLPVHTHTHTTHSSRPKSTYFLPLKHLLTTNAHLPQLFAVFTFSVDIAYTLRNNSISLPFVFHFQISNQWCFCLVLLWRLQHDDTEILNLLMTTSRLISHWTSKTSSRVLQSGTRMGRGKERNRLHCMHISWSATRSSNSYTLDSVSICRRSLAVP